MDIEKLENVKLSNYSTIKIGGIGKCIVFPKNVAQLKHILKTTSKYFVLGNGSNVLFLDEGYDGTLISLKYFDKINVDKRLVTVGAGVNLFTLNTFLTKNNLSGLEWSYGIPGTIGGLVFMNGGSFDSEICQFVEEVKVLKNGFVQNLKRKDINFEYRTSNLSNCIILAVKLKLKFRNHDEILKDMQNYFLRKKTTQPYDMPSLGSVFKQIRGKEIVYPAKLIDNLGLKGVKINGAQISEKHSGFIVNLGGATSKDFLELVELVEKELAKRNVFVKKEIVICEN